MTTKIETKAEPKVEVKIVEKVVKPNYETKTGLLELYQTLKDLGINSIGDLEVRISRAEG